MIAFHVPGVPVSQGSMKAFVVNGRARVTHSNSPELREYRARVAYGAKDIGLEVVDGPIAMEIRFFLQRPKGHFGTGRNAGHVKDSAPDYPTTKPDLDKCVRAVLDSLTGVAYRDDSQVVDLTVSKDYADTAPETYVGIMRVPSSTSRRPAE